MTDSVPSRLFRRKSRGQLDSGKMKTGAILFNDHCFHSGSLIQNKYINIFCIMQMLSTASKILKKN